MNDESVRTWSVEVLIGERDGQTHAEARLRTHDDTHLTAVGRARLRPTDRDVPEIGAELATARALADLSHQLLQAAVDDIEGVTHEPVTLKA
jgi:hypothetical protein